jgi:hypothetical protein
VHAQRSRVCPDRMRMGDDEVPGATLEIVCPARWWHVRRWVAWLGATRRREVSMGASDGGFVFLVLRARPVPPPEPQPIRLRDGRVIRPRAASPPNRWPENK